MYCESIKGKEHSNVFLLKTVVSPRRERKNNQVVKQGESFDSQTIGLCFSYSLLSPLSYTKRKLWGTRKFNLQKIDSIAYYPDLYYVRYLGDRNLSKGFCHQNSKTTAKQRVDFARTNPKVLAEIRKAKGNPLEIYGQMTNKKEGDCEEHAINTVRDEEQVTNALKIQRRQKRMTHDGLFNLVGLELDLGCFISFFQVLPQVVVMGYHADLKEILEKLIDRDDLPYQLLTYDTTFKLGDFYLSTLIFKQTEFKEGPIMPVAYIIHEVKTQSVHELFFKFISQILPGLNDDNCRSLFVIDEEKAIYNALHKYFPNIPIFRCWNHVQKNFMKQLTGPQSMKEQLRKTIKKMFKSNSEEEFKDKLIQEEEQWPQVIQLKLFNMLSITINLKFFD